jgi:putative endonuclease
MKKPNDMPHHQKVGREGEAQAIGYLRANGYQVLHTNWRHGHKELDIVCLRNNVVVVVEVKARYGDYWEEPKEAVKRRQQRNIIEAADAYVDKFDYDLDVQFDIISVVFIDDKTYRLEHIPDAFSPTL